MGNTAKIPGQPLKPVREVPNYVAPMMAYHKSPVCGLDDKPVVVVDSGQRIARCRQCWHRFCTVEPYELYLREVKTDERMVDSHSDKPTDV